MEKNIKFKSNSKKYFYYPLFFCVLIDLLISLSMFLFMGDVSIYDAISIFWKIFFFSTILYKIPLIILFFNHISHNKLNSSLSLKIDDKKNNIYIDSKDKKIKLSYCDILKIEIFLSFPKYDKRMSWLFWDRFFYYKIIMLDGTTHLISCLICDNLFEFYPKNKKERIKLFFPIMFENQMARI